MSEEEKKYFKGLIGFTFDSDDIRYIEKIVDKKDKEIKILNNDIKILLKENENKEKVILKQENIIKEVREYIKQFVDVQKNFYPFIDLRCIDLDKILKILDKVEENK